MKRFEIIAITDQAVGAWYELYHDGQFVGAAGVVWLLRKWARQVWQDI